MIKLQKLSRKNNEIPLGKGRQIIREKCYKKFLKYKWAL